METYDVLKENGPYYWDKYYIGDWLTKVERDEWEAMAGTDRMIVHRPRLYDLAESRYREHCRLMLGNISNQR